MRPKNQSGFRQLALGLSLLIASAAPAFAQSKYQPPAVNTATTVADQILVMAHKGADKDECSSAVREANGTIIKTISNGRLTAYLIQVPAGKQQETMTQLAKNKEHFDSVQMNYRRQARFIPNDPLFPQQYAIPQMNVPAAWNVKADGKGVTVGVIDTGVQGTQADLTGRVDHGFNTVTGGNGDTDMGSEGFFHGTFVSTCSMASTNNFTLGAGPAYRANIIPVDVFNGAAFTTDADILNAIFYLESRHVRLINMSINSGVPNTFANQTANPTLFAAFIDFFNSGGLLFNSAGNDGKFDKSPRTHNLIVVSAIDANEKLTSFSTHGNPLWFTAAGKNIVSSDVDSSVFIADGTSFSSPLAMSVAAQIWTRNPGLSNSQVLQIMVNTAVQPPNYKITKFGFGIPNAGAAVGGH